MKLILFLCLFLTTNYSQLYSQPITAFDSVAASLIGFSPVNIYPLDVQDSFITKYQLRVDTNIQNVKKDYYYFNGYTKSYNPFSILFDSIEVQVMHGRGFDPNRNGYYIILIGYLPFTTGHAEKAKQEVTRLKKTIEEKMVIWYQSASKKKKNPQYEAFYFRSDYNNSFPHLGIGWAANKRKKQTTVVLRVAYTIR